MGNAEVTGGKITGHSAVQSSSWFFLKTGLASDDDVAPLLFVKAKVQL